MTAKTTAERQREYRARQAAASLVEVGGIYAPIGLHPAIRDAAKKIIAKKPRKAVESRAGNADGANRLAPGIPAERLPDAQGSHRQEQ